ncbi:MAG: tetratricopeptide repeat protein [Candidatus Zhuqueibacterota bacterium]
MRKKNIILSFLMWIMFFSFDAPGVTGSELPDKYKKDDVTIDFESRLRFYLDLKTKRFMRKMAVKEGALLEMIRSVTDEVRIRGKAGFLDGDPGFNLIYGKSNKILEEFDAEIDSIKHIVKELDRLELTIQRMEDLKLLKELEQIKDRLLTVLDDQKLATKQLTKQQVASMIDDYSHEINRILKIYEEIETFQKKARGYGDTEIVKQLDLQKQHVIQVLEQSRIAGTAPETVVNSYIEEAASIVEILQQIDDLNQKFGVDSTVNTDVESVRDNIIANVDERIFKLFGYQTGKDFSGVTISEHFNTWKSERIAEYQLKLTQYQILRKSLIQSATPQERNRMLEREITNALLNYSEERYELSELLFADIYEAYGEYFPNLDGVIFYRSEANYANHYYDEAMAGYQKLITDFPQSQYVGQCNLRVAMIHYTYGENSQFFDYYNKVWNSTGIEPEDLNNLHYLAGYLYLTDRRFKDAEAVLLNIKEDSKYYMAAQYLQGIVLTNLEKFTQAKAIFEKLTDQQNYPWTDLNTSIIRNESLLKLGYIHYQHGEYQKASQYFDMVSKGYDRYDSSLLAKAWTNLKKGEYENAISNVDLICNNYLLSNYTYEALVLSAHCKRIQNRTDEAIKDFQYVTNAKYILNQVQEYNKEREHILQQLDELEVLEEDIFEHQNQRLYPEVVRIRDVINDALVAFRFRGAASSRMLEGYNDERKILIRQIEEFERIIEIADAEGDEEMKKDALQQKKRLVAALENFQTEESVSGAEYFMDYPLATKEGGIIYRRGIVQKLLSELLVEKQRVQDDLIIVSELMSINEDKPRMDAAIDLEIIEEELHDLQNQLNQFQVYLANHQVEQIHTNAEHWADLSGFGLSDLNYMSYHERTKKISSYSKNLNEIDAVLGQKRKSLEERIWRFDNEVKKIQKEMEAEKTRLEKLEKEKYFQEIYFETKSNEIDLQTNEEFEELNFENESGKKF